LNRSGLDPVVPIKLIALRGEESAWFGLCYLGSYSLFGQMTAKDLDRKHRSSGRTLREYMSKAGANVAAISQGQTLLDFKDIAAYVELHIEQGPVMVARDVPVGIVTGLRGNIRYNKVLCQGEAGHSGAVPRWLRHDAVFATADLLNRMDEHWRVLLERGLDLVLTAGTLSTNPETHGLTRIPGECEFSLEFRSQSIETLEAFDELVRAEVRSIEKERGVTFEFPVRDITKPAIMDSQWISRLSNSCESLNTKYETLPSGAGHDAAVFANNGIPSAMIFIRNNHGSHNPKEAMEIDDFLKGVDVLHHALLSPP
ncbi:MAG: hydantoinase/carbamoylase family amidase, partial [Rhodospirillaceae bacterium]